MSNSTPETPEGRDPRSLYPEDAKQKSLYPEDTSPEGAAAAHSLYPEDEDGA